MKHSFPHLPLPRHLLSFIFFILSLPATTQVIWTEPPFPTKFDDVTVYYDATQGNATLQGFTGDVYAHTGVITDQSANGNDWKHVIGNWGTPDARLHMTRESDNLYSLSYNISDFYNIPVEENVLKLAFVFRNVNGSIVGRNTDGSDIFTDVAPSDPGLYVTLQEPAQRDVIFHFDDSLHVTAAASDTALLEVYDNDELLKSVNSDQLDFYLHPTTTGNHILKIVATEDTNSFTLLKPFFVLDNNQTPLDAPDETVLGINYPSDSTYLFRMQAPLKDYVFLLTPYNQYTPDTAFLMHKSTDEATFWIELSRDYFADGKTNYQYLVSGGIRVGDPHSEVVLVPVDDAFIDAEVMNTLPPYPDGMTTGIVTAFDEDDNPYPFEVTNFEKPEKGKLIVYELLLRDLIADHSFKSLKDTLDYFERLGVNAIQLMPINEFEGNISWGYNPSYHMAVDKYYGTRDQLKAVIDEAHKRGIAVILDVVYNHTFSQGPFAQMYWDPTNFRPSAESPFLNVTAKHPFNVGYDFNHESPYTKAWVKRTLQYWIDEFKVDGFRFDLSKGLTQFNSGNDAGLMARYDAGRIAILKDYADYIWDLDSTSYVIMEHFADNDEETVLANYGMMLWGNSNHQYIQAAKGFQSDLDWSDYSYRGWTVPHLVSYMESHDEERVIVRVRNEGDQEGDYNTRELNTALERSAAAAAIHFTLPGPKMLWQFGELGFDYSINRCEDGTINNDCRLSPKPIRWDYLDVPERERLRQIYAALFHLKTHYPTFSTSDFDLNDGNLFLKTIHLNHPDMNAVVLANYRVINSEINPRFQNTGTWYEYFTGDSLIVTDTQEKLNFGPGEYRIYTTDRITPPNGFVTSDIVVTSDNIQVYPSLFSSDRVIRGSIERGHVIKSVTITDLHGRQLQPFDIELQDTYFEIELPAGLSQGIYTLTVLTDSILYTARIVKQ